MKLTLNFPDDLQPGIAGARQAYNAANAETEGFVPLETDEAYAEFAFLPAIQSWAEQYAPRKVATDNPKLVGETFTDADGRAALFVEPAQIADPEEIEA